MVRAASRLSTFSSLLTAASLLAAGCSLPVVGSGGPGPAAAPTVAAKTSAQQARPTVQVRRGTITDSIKVLGRVISSQQADLYFRTTNRLRAINTESGQQVHAGDVLAELETGDLLTRIGKAQADLDNANLKLAQAKAKGVIDDSALDAQNVQLAQVKLDQARLNLEKLKAGPLDSDVKDAQSKVATAQAALDKSRSDLELNQAKLNQAQSDLAFKQAGPTLAQLADAQAAVDIAKVKLDQIKAGPRPEDIQAAQLKVDQTRTKLAQLRDTPPVKPEDLANAQLAVQQAQVNLDKVRADTTLTSAQKDAAVRQAQLSVDAAQNTLNAKLALQVSPYDLRLAEEDQAKAENDLAKLTNPSPLDLQQAQVTYDTASAKLQQLQRGPTDQDLAPLQNAVTAAQLALESAKAAVPSAQAALESAQAALSQKLAGPTDFDFRDAQLQVDTAQNNLDQMQVKLAVKQQNLSVSGVSSDYDVQQLQKQVEIAGLALKQLQSNYDDARIIAPYDAKITKVNGKPGDNVQAFNPVVSISSPADLLVQSDVNEGDIPKLAVGEHALITLDVFPGQVMEGTVRDLPSSIVTQQGVVADKSTKIVVNWTRPGADLGMLARVQIIVQNKDNTLIVPTNAIRTVGKRRFVEYMDGNVKRSRNVEIGISTDTDTEILTGLDEGMTILAGT